MTHPSNFISIPINGFLRLSQIVGNPEATPPIQPIIPVSASTWWSKVKTGEYPAPIKLSANITAWKVEDIRELIEQINSQEEEI